MFWKPFRLANGQLIATAPVTDTTFYFSTSAADARAGVFSYSVSAGADAQTPTLAIPAGLWYVTAICSNANGAGYRSQVFTVTVT